MSCLTLCDGAGYRRRLGCTAARPKAKHEAYLPAEPRPPQTGPRLPCKDEEPCWSGDPETPPREGAQAARRVPLVQVGVAPGEQRLGRQQRLRRTRDFRRISGEGERFASRSFVVLIRRPGGAGRLGVTVSRRVGGAVQRNLVKRRIREWFRRHSLASQGDCDVVVIARPGAARIDSTTTVDELDHLVLRATRSSTARGEA